ncbi:MAG TPA: hypothetical protein PKY31_11205 [Spirochaetota bacterium]|nr:hypothetical protein [Spirochaetota bacterium]
MEQMGDVMQIYIPCRACRESIRATVSPGYSLDELLQRHGYIRSLDGVGAWCEQHIPGTQHHEHQDNDAEDLPHLFPDDTLSPRRRRRGK